MQAEQHPAKGSLAFLKTGSIDLSCQILTLFIMSDFVEAVAVTEHMLEHTKMRLKWLETFAFALDATYSAVCLTPFLE
jgi:hypothetical protein